MDCQELSDLFYYYYFYDKIEVRNFSLSHHHRTPPHPSQLHTSTISHNTVREKKKQTSKASGRPSLDLVLFSDFHSPYRYLFFFLLWPIWSFTVTSRRFSFFTPGNNARDRNNLQVKEKRRGKKNLTKKKTKKEVLKQGSVSSNILPNLR